ncbi:hypothetical protein BGZ73_007255 [Actinomortierella ambigua]|nr:hypothetical protein BGZ73_007255 [Actinomortierella ambigua]
MNTVMLTIVQERFRKVQELLRSHSSSSGVHSKFLVILDESQFLGRIFSETFFDSDMTIVRPVLAPVLFDFRRLADRTSQDNVCVMPCGTGLSSYELTWSGGSAAGDKLSADDYKASRLSEMVFDFAGWTDDRLTTASIPTTDGEKRRLEGNLCGQLHRMFEHVRHDHGNLAFAEFRNVEATLKLAVATFVTQGGTMAFKGQLPKLVETAFGRIKLIDGDFYATIDEPFALLAAHNYFQNIDPDYPQFRLDQLERTSTERTRGKEWEVIIPFEWSMYSTRRFRHDCSTMLRLLTACSSANRLLSTVVGWTGVMRTTGNHEMTMGDFLDAHINIDSEHEGQPVPLFFYPKEHVSGPDIVFVVRFSGMATNDTQGSRSTPSPDSVSSEIICPVLVQLKLCEKLSQADVVKARGTVQPRTMKCHGVKLSQFCRHHGYYTSLIVSYPVEIADYFIDRPLVKHKDGLTEIALTIDDNNIDDPFTEKYVHALKRMKRL